VLLTPHTGRVRSQTNYGSVGGASIGTGVQTSGTATVKGTPAQLIASTSFDAWGVIITAHGYGSNTATSEGALDILIGAATEDILIPDLLMGFCGNWAAQDKGPKTWFFPLYVPAGSRIAAQACGIRLTTTFQVGIQLLGGTSVSPWRVGRKVITYGVTAPNGIAITPGASGAQGAYAQITAATSADHFALVPSFQLGPSDTSIANRNYMVGIGVGAATEDLVGEYVYTTDAGETMGGPYPVGFPTFIDIPSGTRLAMRASCSGTVDTVAGAIHAVS
jgi:hypothetical protein